METSMPDRWRRSRRPPRPWLRPRAAPRRAGGRWRFTVAQASSDAALAAGQKVLAARGSSLDAVEAVIRVLEDNPLFNAGRGAVFTAEGRNELDAAIMDGSTLTAGAVAGVTRTRHPISLARRVMEKTPH